MPLGAWRFKSSPAHNAGETVFPPRAPFFFQVPLGASTEDSNWGNLTVPPFPFPAIAHAIAGVCSLYHAIVRARPSSRSTFASNPSTSRAFSTFGMRSSTST